MKILPFHMTAITREELDELALRPHGLSDFDCRCLVAYMMGYLRMADNIEHARQVFFQHIKANQQQEKP